MEHLYEHGDKIIFQIMDCDKQLPVSTGNEGYAIAFVPGQGFQWARYYNGSNTWMSMVTYETIKPTQWLQNTMQEYKPEYISGCDPYKKETPWQSFWMKFGFYRNMQSKAVIYKVKM